MDKKKILVADDELNIRSLVSKLLNRDYIVIEATNGKEAVDIAKREKPDLILMDLMMPEMDGYTACSIIKADQATQSIPVVILTAVSHELNKKLAKEIGASGYLTKPFQLQDLLDAIDKFL